MRRIAPLLALGLVVSLAGCSLGPKPDVTTTPPPAPHVATPSPVTLAPCTPPVKLRPGAATQQQVEQLWGVDDDHLIDCATRQKILADFAREELGGLATPRP
jgi:hypothetical protein